MRRGKGVRDEIKESEDKNTMNNLLNIVCKKL
jgi:hypothetical protein